MKTWLSQFFKSRQEESFIDQNKRLVIQFTILGFIAVISLIVFTLIWRAF